MIGLILGNIMVVLGVFSIIKGKYPIIKRYNGEKMRLKDDQILVIEGIHCLNDKLTSLIPKDQKYKIYIKSFLNLA